MRLILSFAVTILGIGSKECLDKTTATRNNLTIAGAVCVRYSSHQPRVKKLPEQSQSVERCGRYRKDQDVEGPGSITSSMST
jgi:hypothetical protein